LGQSVRICAVIFELGTLILEFDLFFKKNYLGLIFTVVLAVAA